MKDSKIDNSIGKKYIAEKATKYRETIRVSASIALKILEDDFNDKIAKLKNDYNKKQAKLTNRVENLLNRKDHKLVTKYWKEAPNEKTVADDLQILVNMVDDS